jgi:hypothetical protein
MLKLAEDSRKVIPTDKLFRKGQEIIYKGVLYTRKIKNIDRMEKQTVTGIVEYVTPFVVGVRESNGQMQTFTAVDLFTGDVKILRDAKDQFSILLGLS